MMIQNPTGTHHPFHYYLGCPMWANRDWQGHLFSKKAGTAEYLPQYAKVFNTVEGNTTFYGVPKAETVALWRDRTPAHFRFCFKFPRSISHEAGLRACQREVEAFLQRMSLMGGRLGPFFLQLPPSFEDLAILERFLVALPRDWAYAIELRHPSFFDGGTKEQDTDAMLSDLNMDRVIFDTRRLHAIEGASAEVRAAQKKKPKTPVRMNATAKHPFLRFVGHPDMVSDEDLLRLWARQVVTWSGAGKMPYVFIHHVPDDDLAPELARRFHEMIRALMPAIPAMAPWSGELEERARKEQESAGPTQLSLF